LNLRNEAQSNQEKSKAKTRTWQSFEYDAGKSKVLEASITERQSYQ
jgi:hypothetical protein